jgi:predicted flap endonuclease-1-like 5' DNA nuclease
MAGEISLSVLIPVRADTPEAVDWLHEAVASIDYPARIIIADDGSTQDLREAEIPHALVYRFARPNGVVAARNFLGGRCETEYLCFLDADDKFEPGKLSVLAADAKPDRVVYGNMIWDGTGHAVKYHVWPEYDCDLMFRRAIVPVTSIHSKAAFDKAGGFDPNFEEMLEDWDYNIRLMLAGYCGHYIAEHVMIYRQHPGARSRKGRDVLRRMRRLLDEKHNDARSTNMGCCGGGAVRQPRSAVQADRLASVRSALDGARGDMVLVEYVGAKTGKITIRGRVTNQPYRFAATPDDHLRYVYKTDAEHLLTLPEFRLKTTEGPQEPAPAPVKAAAAPVLVSKPSIEGSPQRPTRDSGKAKPAPDDDLTQIRGISKRRAEALAAFGLRRYRDLLVYSAPELLEVAKQADLKGILSEEMMAGWLEQARELAR